MSSTAIITINRRRLGTGIAVAMLAVAPAAYAMPADVLPTHATVQSSQVVGSPDARDANLGAQTSQVVASDLRSPDARDASRDATAPRGDAGYAGLRSPVARVVPTAGGTSATLATDGSNRPSWALLIGGLGVALILGMGLNEAIRRHRPGHGLAITRG